MYLANKPSSVYNRCTLLGGYIGLFDFSIVSLYVIFLFSTQLNSTPPEGGLREKKLDEAYIYPRFLK